MSPKNLSRLLLFAFFMVAAQTAIGQEQSPGSTVTPKNGNIKPSGEIELNPLEKREVVQPRMIPTPDQVVRMVAEVYNRETPDVAPFDIPQEYIPTIIRSFGTPQFEPDTPILFDELGSIKLYYGDGSVDRLSWWFMAGNRLFYSFCNTPCIRGGDYYFEYGDEGAYLANMIRVIYQRVSGNDVGGNEDAFPDKLCAVMDNASIRANIKKKHSPPRKPRYRCTHLIYEMRPLTDEERR